MSRGLVLCGGGSKGSYEMGAWTALKELKEEFQIVMPLCSRLIPMIDVRSYGIKLR